METDTIIAISTPRGYGGIGIVRLSGKKSLPIALQLFRPKKDKNHIPPRTPVLGSLFHLERKDYFEEGYLIYFPAPQTYTRENMVEISCHGSPLILEEIVRLGVKAGARLANPGEFTLRAYLNGRIDIIQAEAINDLIRSCSLTQAQISFHQVQGSLSAQIHSLRQNLVQLLSQIEASIEFPEEGLNVSSEKTFEIIDKAISQVQTLVGSYQLGKTLGEGVSLAIAGRTNVGKSTLFNSLLQEQRAIVSPYPGTTRDYLQEKIMIKDSIFTLVDMAGLETPSHPVEKESIKRGKKLAAEADGIILLLDSSQQESTKDLNLVKKYKNKNLLLVFNKTDLPQKINKEEIKKEIKTVPSLEISALKGTNLDKLKQKMYKLFVPQKDKYQEVVLHSRQKLLLQQILEHLKEGKRLFEEGYSEEIYAEEIRKATSIIGQLTGEVKVEEVINNIFSRFCVGK